MRDCWSFDLVSSYNCHLFDPSCNYVRNDVYLFEYNDVFIYYDAGWQSNWKGRDGDKHGGDNRQGGYQNRGDNREGRGGRGGGNFGRGNRGGGHFGGDRKGQGGYNRENKGNWGDRGDRGGHRGGHYNRNDNRGNNQYNRQQSERSDGDWKQHNTGAN